MLDYDEGIKLTPSPSQTCAVAVKDMKLLKEAMEKDLAKFNFDAGTYHEWNELWHECTLCVAGAVARGFGVPDDENWTPFISRNIRNLEAAGIEVTDHLRRQVSLFNRRMEFLSDLRIGRVDDFDLTEGWEDIKLDYDTIDDLSMECKQLYDKHRPKNSEHLEGHIELYKHYQKFFEDKGL